METKYDVPAQSIRWLEERFKQIEKRAKRIGVPAPTFEKIRTHTVTIRDEGRKLNCPYVEIVVTGDAPTVPGHTFVATLQREGGAVIIREVPGTTEEGELYRFRRSEASCDHCRTNRRRKDTYVLREEKTGELKQIGRTCLKDYTGAHDPMKAARFAELWNSIEEFMGLAEDRGFGSTRGEDVLSLEDAMAWISAVTRVHGYLSKTKAREKYGDSSGSTAEIVWSVARNEKARRRLKVSIEDRDEKEAERLLSLVDEFLPDDDEASDYLYNLRQAYDLGYVTWRTIGLISSLPNFLRRELAKKAERESDRKDARHVGVEGEHLDIVAEIVGVHPYESMFGVGTLVRFNAEGGGRIHWFTSKYYDSSKVGKTVHLVGTVKKHEEDRRTELPVTVMTRCAIHSDVEGFRRTVSVECPHCGAAVGEWCRTPKGKRNGKIHAKRSKLTK